MPNNHKPDRSLPKNFFMNNSKDNTTDTRKAALLWWNELDIEVKYELLAKYPDVNKGGVLVTDEQRENIYLAEHTPKEEVNDGSLLEGKLYVGMKNIHNTSIPILKYVDNQGSAKGVATIKYNDYKPTEFDVTESEAEELAALFAESPQLKAENTKLQSQVKVLLEDNTKLVDENARLRESLNKIAKWELPVTGLFWDKEEKQPMSYDAAFGSNGVRDYIKGVAINTLNQ